MLTSTCVLLKQTSTVDDNDDDGRLQGAGPGQHWIGARVLAKDFSSSFHSGRWLTDVSRKVKEEGEKAEGDEDGPPSELEEEQRAEVSASESESEARVGAFSSSREPYVAWNR